MLTGITQKDTGLTVGSLAQLAAPLALDPHRLFPLLGKVAAVQEVNTAKNYYACTKAMVVTNSYFTHQARNLARASHVELWDRNELVKRLLTLNEDTTVTPQLSRSLQMSVPAPTSITDTTCAQYGKPVSAKVRDYCLSHRSAFSGKVYCYEHQKQAKKTSTPHH